MSTEDTVLSDHVVRSPEGELLLWGYPRKMLDYPVLTATMSGKWYCLYLVMPGEKDIRRIVFDELENYRAPTGEAHYIDHVPNPAVLEQMVEENDWGLNKTFMEVAESRWREARGD